MYKVIDENTVIVDGQIHESKTRELKSCSSCAFYTRNDEFCLWIPCLDIERSDIKPVIFVPRKETKL